MFIQLCSPTSMIDCFGETSVTSLTFWRRIQFMLLISGSHLSLSRMNRVSHDGGTPFFIDE